MCSGVQRGNSVESLSLFTAGQLHQTARRAAALNGLWPIVSLVASRCAPQGAGKDRSMAVANMHVPQTRAASQGEVPITIQTNMPNVIMVLKRYCLASMQRTGIIKNKKSLQKLSYGHGQSSQ